MMLEGCGITLITLGVAMYVFLSVLCDALPLTIQDIAVPMWEYADPKIWADWNWTERYPTRAELGQYFHHVCEKLQVRKNIIFNTKVTAAQWDESGKKWYIYSGDRLLAITQFFIPCTGYVTTKYVPEIKGLSTFPAAYHTCEWPRGIDLDNKRVGVIGTGASGLQVVEQVGPKASHLTVFQRAPNLATPRYQQAMTPESNAAEKLHYPARFANRMSFTGYDTVDYIPRDTMSDTPAQRQATYEALWQKGGASFWFGNYRDMMTSPAANAAAYAFWRSKALPRIASPATAAVLAPELQPYPFGTKRPSLEEHYYEVFNQPNVTLIDLLSDPILEITPTGITTSSGTHHALDVLVLATGYDFVVGSLLAIDIRGRGNISLRDKWGLPAAPGRTSDATTTTSDTTLKTHLGLSTSAFPNLFFPIGPQAPTSFALTPMLAEIQAAFLVSLLSYARALNPATFHARTVETTPAAEQKWTQEVGSVARGTLIAGARTWYMGVNIPGRRREALCWFGGVGRYVEFLEMCESRGWEGWVFGGGGKGGGRG